MRLLANTAVKKEQILRRFKQYYFCPISNRDVGDLLNEDYRLWPEIYAQANREYVIYVRGTHG